MSGAEWRDVGGWHDMGGRLDTLADPRVDRAEHARTLSEKRVDALQVLLAGTGLYTVDGLRRALEDMGPTAFECMTYYERWVQAIAMNLLERGVVTVEELRARTEAIMARGATYADASAPPR